MRAFRALAAVGFLALLAALAGPAAGQAPSASPSVTVTAAEDEGTVTVERTSSFTVTVRNTSPESPLDEQNKGDVAITVSGVPEGWTATALPANFELAPGDSLDVEIQVAVSTEATAGSAELTVTAEMYSPLRGLDPVLGGVPGATQRSTGEATLRLTLDDSVTRDVLEAIGPWIYAVLLLLVVAVLVAVGISVAARRTLVRLSAEAREQPVPPGGKAVFPFRAEGLGKEADSVLLQVSAVQEGWAAFLPVPELMLEPGRSQEMSLVVLAPREALQGTRQAILVTATSAKAPKGMATLEFVAVVEGPEELPAKVRRKVSVGDA